MIIPSGQVAAPRIAWPLSSALPPLGALTSAPGTARAHVRAVLPGWGLADLIEVCELVTSELTTNAVKASTSPGGGLLYVNGRMPVIRVCLLSDGSRLLVEVHDQALGVPVVRDAAVDAVSGRGLPMVHALTVGQWGWRIAPAKPGKCVWAALSIG